MATAGLDLALLLGATVTLVAVAAVRLSARVGLPGLLAYLALGVLLGPSGLGLAAPPPRLAQDLAMSALVIILAEGGLTTRWPAARQALGLATVLATVGFAVSVLVTAGVARLVLGADWRLALLIGAVLSPTDAAAVFAVLRRLRLRPRLAAALEAESGLNDAPAVLLVTLLVAGTGGGALGSPAGLVLLAGYELLAGAAVGVAVGLGGAWVLRRSALPAAGLYPLSAVGIAVLAYAAAATMHASGFLAGYLAGVVLGNAGLPHRRAVLGFAEALGWLAQIGLFVLLGLLAAPARLAGALGPALLVGAGLALAARPLSVLVSAPWFRVPARQQVLLSWAGLRGAVPIVLATIPVTAGIAGSDRLFDTVFVLVVVFTVLQGGTLPVLSRRLGMVEAAEPTELAVDAAPLDGLGADLLQLTIPSGSHLAGTYVGELRLPPLAVVSLLVRDGRAVVPAKDTRLRVGDQLLVVAASPAREATLRRLRAVSRRGRLARWFGEFGEERP